MISYFLFSMLQQHVQKPPSLEDLVVLMGALVILALVATLPPDDQSAEGTEKKE